MLRQGQALFNALSNNCGSIAHKITTTEYDCFYRDELIPDFKEKVIELLNLALVQQEEGN
jgi:hypothetical protein